MASISTSSGHGGRFGFGLTSRAQAGRLADVIDLGLDYSYGPAKGRTLLVNCLPGAARLASRFATVVETGVREDVALAVIDAARHEFGRVFIVAEPLFLKRLSDEAQARRFHWRGFELNVIVGGETFGENFRDFLAARLGLEGREDAIRSSLGLGELGLNLMFETPATIGLRRATAGDEKLARLLFGFVPPRTPPLLFVYNPLRTFIEILDADRESGFGALAISLLDRASPQPIFRYRTGDRARLVDRAQLAAAGIEAPGVLPLIAFEGREGDRLADGVSLLDVKEALYANPDLARKLSGAFHVRPTVPGAAGITVEVQIGQGHRFDRWDREALERHLPRGIGRSELVVWPYAQFPYGMRLDYERKFNYLAPATMAQPRSPKSREDPTWLLEELMQRRSLERTPISTPAC